MDDQEESSTPFWVKPSAHRRRISSGALLFVLCICISIFTLFVLPRIVSVTPHIVTPRKDFVKKSWDSLNITLVLLALIFTFLSRNINHDNDYGSKSTGSTPRGWYESSNRTPMVGSMAEVDSTVFKSFTPRGWYEGSGRTATVGLRKSYGSYRDLREISEDKVDRWRSYDDMSLGTRAPPLQDFVNADMVSKVAKNVSRVNDLDEADKSNGTMPGGLYENLDQTVVVGMRRSYGSYPDIREISEDNSDRRQFYDDTSLDTHASRVSRDSPVQSVENSSMMGKLDDNKVTEAYSKNFEDHTNGFGTGKIAQLPVSKAPSDRVIKPVNDDRSEISGSESRCFVPAENVDPGSKPTDESSLPEERVIEQVPAVSCRTRRTTESVISKVKSSEEMSNWDPVENFSHRRTKSTDEIDSILFEASRSERKRGAGNVTRHFLDSFRKKKKKQRQKSVENFETLLGSQPHTSQLKGKKKIDIVPPPPPPPPPPYLSRAQKSTSQITPTTTRRPPLPMKIQSFVSEGGESPLHPIPPPPPLPPFKMPKWKFVVKGDYVTVGSMSISPDSPTSSESGDTPKETNEDATMFCPSPDVNSKADMFIAKFRAGLKLQKMNSMKQKQGLGLSNLGPTRT